MTNEEIRYKLLEMSLRILNENIDRKIQMHNLNRELGKPTPPLTNEFVNYNEVVKVASRLDAFIKEK
jgi:hypothetical protein